MGQEKKEEIAQNPPQNKNERPDFLRQLELAARSSLRMLTISEKTKLVKITLTLLFGRVALRLQVNAGLTGPLRVLNRLSVKKSHEADTGKGSRCVSIIH